MTRLAWRPAAWVLFACAAAAAAVLLNLLLLDHATAQNDPVGKLTPRTHLPAAPKWTVRPTRGQVRDEGADD